MSEQPTPSEQKPVKKVPKKKPEAKEKEVSGRARAKTTIFESKSKQESNTNKIKPQGIGEGKFTNLLSMFDKNKQKSDENAPKETDNKITPGTIDPNKLFNKNVENADKKTSVVEVPKTMSIQERMANLMKESEKTKAKGSKMIDPVLEMKRQEDEDYDEDNSNPELSEEDDLNLDDDDVQDNEVKDEEEKEEELAEIDDKQDKGKTNNDELGGDDIIDEPEIKPEDIQEDKV